MTAEIAVMNKDAVALAADSTVTVMDNKTYNTMNKLFSLSQHYPVGIMIYGDPELGGVPWETIIKLFRQHVKAEKDYLENYMDDFISFIEHDMQKEYAMRFKDALNDFEHDMQDANNQSNNDFEHDMQDANNQSNPIDMYADDYLHQLRDKIDTLVEKYIEDEGKISDEKVKFIVEKCIDEDEKDWQGKQKLPFATNELVEKFTENKALHPHFCKMVEELFEKHDISDAYLNKLTAIITNIFLSQITDNSGIIFAGFGAKEIFPSLISFNIECFVGNKLKLDEEKNAKISNEGLDEAKKRYRALITPFAQTETVQLFMCGISKQLRKELDECFQNLLINILENGLQTQLKEFLADEQIKTVLEKILSDNALHVENAMRHHHINPIMQAIEFLPKNEMAEVAESLVSLTSFQQKVSLNRETVGGAIDVAVISKTDGFVWIKRKHYFKPELNPMFMSRYFGRNDLSGG